MPPVLEPVRAGVKWNEVTWYSKLGAIILFVGVIPALSFYIGMQYQAVKDMQDSTKHEISFTPKIFQASSSPPMNIPSDWKTVTNTEYGFSISVPNYFTLIELSDI
jgi:hypothetical protein